jgi:hypothetical protein
MPKTPPPPRFIAEELDNGIQVILPSKKNFFHLLWHGLWLIGWSIMTTVGIFILAIFAIGMTGFPNDLPESPNEFGSVIGTWIFVALFLGFIVGLGGVATYSFLWKIAGKEIVVINNQLMSIARQIFGWRRSTEYYLDNVIDLRVSFRQQPHYAPLRAIKSMLGRDGIIAFDYGAKTYRFGLDIEEAEAKQIIAALKHHIPQSKAG